MPPTFKKNMASTKFAIPCGILTQDPEHQFNYRNYELDRSAVGPTRWDLWFVFDGNPHMVETKKWEL